MSLTDRDRKIVTVLVALALIAGYWLLLLGPKREEAQVAADELTQQEERRDAAEAQVADLQAAEKSFESDYATVVRLGKAIPSTVDVPSLMVQLQDAAQGTSISFDSITAGEREAAPVAAAPAPPSESGDPATTTPAETPESPPVPADGSTPAASTTTPPPAEGTTAPPPPEGTTAPPPAEGTTAPPPPEGTPTATTTDQAATAAPALESVPLDFEFRGSFFELADFFHEMKRFVHVAGDRVDVSGRLMTIDSIDMSSDETFPVLTAEVSATAYVAPAAQGATAGATPEGPPGTMPAGTQPAPGATPTGSSAAPPPATGVTP